MAGEISSVEDNPVTDISPDVGNNINNASLEELFESLFADTGSRETIAIRDWKDGWPAIVGGINGIPTSRQFNTLQYITDLKCLKLYRDVVALQLAGSASIKIGTIDELDKKNMILFEILKNTNRIFKVHRKDSEENAYEYELASVFDMPEKRGELKSGDTLAELFGQIARYLEDLKPNCFSDADDPFVQMAETAYIPPSLRTKGSLYGLITNRRGLIIERFDRYVSGLEDPTKERTLYGIETLERTEAEADGGTYVGILNNLIHIEEGQEIERKPYMIYAVKRETREVGKENG